MLGLQTITHNSCNYGTVFFSNGAKATRGPGPHYWGFAMTDTPHWVGLLLTT